MIIVNPNNRNPSPMSAVEPPIWCAYWARKYPGHTTILDAEAEALTVDGTVSRIGNEPCVLVAMGANPSASSTPKMNVIGKLASSLKFYHISGLHPQASRPDKRRLRLHRAELCRLTPRWDLVDFSKYRAHNWHCLHDLNSRGNYGVIYTSFGCPYNCLFCNIHTLYGGRQVAYRKPEDVIAEVETLVETHSVQNLKVCDELFVLNHHHVGRICDLLIERDYNLNIWAYARVDTVTPELLEKMKRAGFNWLAYGFEASSLDKYATDPFKAREMTREAGINVMGNFMFGLPEETMEDMGNTKQLASELQCEYVNFYVALPYPGSEWCDSLKDKPTDWSSYDQFADNICAEPEVVRFRDQAFREYFSDGQYLRMIETQFGIMGTEHIKEMLGWNPREVQDGHYNLISSR
ncbi:hypothetical protein CMI37_31780 [Candidatus Pacearchaeota archaeon]|nr:hypothetical protein [Candidatus Pacearchaeota archaeon]